MRTNFHTHTAHCRHAGGNAIDFAKKAFDCNFDILGFSDHCPFKGDPFGSRMPFSEFPQYLEEVDAERERYKGKMEILKAVEVEYLPDYLDYYDELLSKYKLEYFVLGEHFFKDPFNNMYNVYALEDTEDTIKYAAAIVEAMKTGFFQYLAHPDLFTINDKFGWNDDYDRASDIIIDAAFKYNVILEYNANGLRRGIQLYPDGERYKYPHKNFWEKLRGTTHPVVIGSDSHNPKEFWDDAMLLAKKNLDDLNIKPIEDIRPYLKK